MKASIFLTISRVQKFGRLTKDLLAHVLLRLTCCAALLFLFTSSAAFGQSSEFPTCIQDETNSSQCTQNISIKMYSTGYPTDCGDHKFQVYFENNGSLGAPTVLGFQSMHVRFKITGDAVFDKQFFIGNNSTIYSLPNSNILTSFTTDNYHSFFYAQGKVLDWYIACDNTLYGGVHQFAVGAPGGTKKDILNAYYITDALKSGSSNDNISISIESAEVTGITTANPPSPFLTCSSSCCSLTAGSNITVTAGYTYACSNNLSGVFLSPVNFPATGEIQEITNSLEIENTGSSFDFDELDIRIRFTDVNESMPNIEIAQLLSSPIISEAIYDENGSGNAGETSTFYFKYGAGTLVNGSNPFLDFLCLNPQGFENLEGEGQLVVEYIRIKPSGGSSCCKIMDETEVDCEFPGEPECDNGDLTIRIAAPQSSPSGPCNTGFSVNLDILGTGNLYLEELYIEIDVVTYGMLDFSEIIANDASLSCVNATSCPNTGCSSVCNNGKIIIDFSDAMSPLYVNNGDFFDVLFDGNNGGISSINVTQLKIKELVEEACIPDFVVYPGLIFPIEKCDYCSSIEASTGEYDGTYTLNSACESGISLYLDLGSENVDEIEMEFNLSVTGSVTISSAKSESFCDALSNSCDPGAGSSNCMEISGNTVVLHYCGSQLTGIQQIDLVMSGTGMVSELNFTTLKVHPVSGSTCDVLYVGADTGVFPLTPSGSSCPSWNLFGYVRDELGHGLENAEICVTEDELTDPVYPVNEYDCVSAVETSLSDGDNSGIYQATFSAQSDSKYLTPTKNCADLPGATTFDLVLISRHVLGISPLGSPYKIIAADANHSQTVTTFDIVEIRKLILFINTVFPHNSSWRFVDESYSFPIPANPFAFVFPEFIEASLSEPPPFNFVAIKVGDVNNSVVLTNDCTTSFAPESDPVDRDKPGLTIAAKNSLNLKAGDSGWLDFTLSGEQATSAWQLGLLFDPSILQIDEIRTNPDFPDFNVDDNFGVTEIIDGKLRSLWYSPNGNPRFFDKSETIFSVHVRAVRDIDDAASLVDIDNRVLNSLAYSEDGTEYALGMTQGNTAATTIQTNGLAVKILPNPFSQKVTFNLGAPRNEYFNITIINQLGETVANWRGQVPELDANVVFDKTENWGTGVFNYVIQTSNGFTSGRMTKI